MQRYFLKNHQFQAKQVRITDEDAHHIARVMRMEVGERIFVCNEDKECYYLTITAVTPDEVTGEIGEAIESDTELPIEVTIAQGLPKGDKFEFVLQKACELGVHHIIPLSSKRCVVKLTKDKFNKKLPRYQKILKEASEQSGRNRIPSIEEVKTIKELKPYLKDYNLVAYEETAKQHEHGELFHTLQQLKAGDQLLIIVGCEGGFDESEIQELNEMGVKCCSLGNRILRSETAPLYLMSVIGYSRELTK